MTARNCMMGGLIVSMALLAGCSAPPGGTDLKTPATYSGKIPCADCAGIDMTLTLRPDSLFLLRQIYLDAENGGDRTVLNWGKWTYDRSTAQVTLIGDEFQQVFGAIDSTGLRLLDRQGKEIGSEPDYDLKAVSTIDPLPDIFRMAGKFRYMADAGLFTGCLTGHRFPVAHKGVNALLERMYGNTRGEPGSDVLVILDGRLEKLPAMEGDALQEMLIVERVLGMWPDQPCQKPPGATLENTFWELVSIDKQAVPAAPDLRQPYLQIVSGAEAVVAGFAGCNSFGGNVRILDSSLKFGLLNTTMMICPYDQNVEQPYLRALERVNAYKMSGDTLILEDAAGERLRFLAGARSSRSR